LAVHKKTQYTVSYKDVELIFKIVTGEKTLSLGKNQGNYHLCKETAVWSTNGAIETVINFSEKN